MHTGPSLGGVEDVVSEAADARVAGVAEVIECEEVFDAAQERVVVVGGRVDLTGSRPARDDDGTDASPSEAGDARERRVRAGALAALLIRFTILPSILPIASLQCKWIMGR